MDLFSSPMTPALTSPAAIAAAAIPTAHLDLALSMQLAVGWAGEGGEEPRLAWWRCDLATEFGGEDLFKRLLPSTWAWATLQGAREAARRKDAELRAQDHNPDRLLSLFNLGFEISERVEERLRDLKHGGKPPHEALPVLKQVLTARWRREDFAQWVTSFGPIETVPTLAGRRIKGEAPEALDAQVRKLVAGLAPLSEKYPMPHFQRSV